VPLDFDAVDRRQTISPEREEGSKQRSGNMYMRIIWGRIAAGQWDGFEAAYKKATTLRGNVKGLKNQWLARDQSDPDAGYSVTLWETEADMRAFWESKKREEAMALLRPFFLNQFTVTQCEVRYTQQE
jgi:heme-degrading monooxygenase HmoA